MEELEIKPDGEVFADGELVGRITWIKPLLGRFFAGEFYPNPEDQDWFGCPRCVDADQEVDDLNTQLEEAKTKLAAIEKINRKMATELNRLRHENRQVV